MANDDTQLDSKNADVILKPNCDHMDYDECPKSFPIPASGSALLEAGVQVPNIPAVPNWDIFPITFPFNTNTVAVWPTQNGSKLLQFIRYFCFKVFPVSFLTSRFPKELGNFLQIFVQSYTSSFFGLWFLWPVWHSIEGSFKMLKWQCTKSLSVSSLKIEVFRSNLSSLPSFPSSS